MTGFEAIREIYGLTLEDIAKMTGITKQSVSEWGENGKPIPKRRVKQLSKKLGIDETFFTLNEIDEVQKLEIRSQQLLHSINGMIEVETLDIIEDKNHPQLMITPKNFDTDPRLAKIYQNHLHTGLLQELQSLNELFVSFEKGSYETEQDKTDTLKDYCELVTTFIDVLLSEKADYYQLLEDLKKHL